MEIDIDNIIQRLLALKDAPFGQRADLKVEEIKELCVRVQRLFEAEPTLLEVTPPLTIVGDIHGQFHDLLRLFDATKYPPETRFLFLGDYVDRGDQGIEVCCLLFCYKIKYPDRVFMLRGNHECRLTTINYGFQAECRERNTSGELWKEFLKVFQWLPIAAIVQKKIFCVHGGIAPGLRSLDLIKNIKRPTEIPEEGLLTELVWSDPDPDIDEWCESDRGIGWCFGAEAVAQFLEKFDFDLICRAHQAVMNGYEFPFLGNQSLLTLFSAPNYCYEYDNRGAVLHVDDKLLCSFTIIEPKHWKEEEPIVIGERPATPPREGSEAQEDISMFQVTTS